MSNEIKIAAEARTEFGKGAARRVRRENKVPGVIYGHGTDPVHVTLPGHETLLALRQANALLAITVDGGRELLALPKSVSRDPIKGFLEHVDLIIVKRGEKVTVDVPLTVVGGEKEDRILVVDAQSVSVEAPATAIPAGFEFDASELEIGDQVTAAQLTLPEGVSLAVEEDTLLLSVAPAPTAEEIEAELDAAVADATDEEKVAEQEAAAEEKAAAAGDDAEAPAEGEASEDADKADAE